MFIFIDCLLLQNNLLSIEDLTGPETEIFKFTVGRYQDYEKEHERYRSRYFESGNEWGNENAHNMRGKSKFLYRSEISGDVERKRTHQARKWAFHYH